MSQEVRNDPDHIAYALLAAYNRVQADAIGSFFHQSRTENTTRGDYRNQSVTRVTVSAANATDLATSVTLVNQIKAVLNQHFVDPNPVHNTAVSAAVATADATDLATGITLGNALKAAFNTHRTASNVHFTNDSTNAVSSADSTDQTSLNTLLNEMKGDVNAHLASAPNGTYLVLKTF